MGVVVNVTLFSFTWTCVIELSAILCQIVYTYNPAARHTLGEAPQRHCIVDHCRCECSISSRGLAHRRFVRPSCDLRNHFCTTCSEQRELR